MNFQQKSVLKLSIVAALSAGADSALAALDLTATTKTPVYFAKEIPVATTLGLGNAAAAVPLVAGVDVTTMPLTVKLASIPSYAINTSNTFFVKLSLTNGAKFGTTTGVVGYCNTGAATVGTDLTSGTPLTVSLGAGTNSVTLNAAPPAATSAVLASTTALSLCYVQFTGVTVSGNGDVSVSADVLYTDASVQKTNSVSATFISFKRGAEVTVGGAGANAVIDVTTASKAFAATGSDKAVVKVGSKTALVGSISYAVPATATLNALGAAFTGAGFVSGSNAAAVFSVTISGPAVSSAKTAYITSTPDCTAATTLLASATPASASVTVSGINATQAAAGLYACLSFDGTTAISDGQITLSLANLGAETTLANPDFTTPSPNSYKFTKNGASVKINFLTNPTGFQSYVRFTNPTSTNGNIFIDVYNDDGVKGATTVTVPLDAGKSLMYPTTQLVTASGVVAATSVQPTGALAPNKYRLIINADFDTLNAQALSLSKDGQNFGQLTDK